MTERELAETELFADNYANTCSLGDNIGRRAMIHETVRAMINEIVTDLIDHSSATLAAQAPADIEAVRDHSAPLIGLSPESDVRHRALKRFLNGSLYRHERVRTMTERAHEIVRGLFECYMNDTRAMPKDHAQRAREWAEQTGDSGRARAVADYVAGMTDRYAYSAYQRMVGVNLWGADL